MAREVLTTGPTVAQEAVGMVDVQVGQPLLEGQDMFIPQPHTYPQATPLPQLTK